MKTIVISCIVFFLIGIQMCKAQTISTDDTYHFTAGALISATTYAIVYSSTKNKKKAFWVSFGSSVLAGVAKEVYDSSKKNNRFDPGEMFATSFGGLTASVTLNLFAGKKKKSKVALVN